MSLPNQSASSVAMRNNCDVVIISTSRWDNPYSSVGFSFAKEFAKNNRVFYIDHPFSLNELAAQYSNNPNIKPRMPALLFGKSIYRKIDGLPDNLTIVTPKLTLPINWLSEGYLYDLLWKLNERAALTALSKTIKDFNIKRYVFFNSFNPYYFKKIPLDIKPLVKIYQTIDDITQETYVARHGVRLEQEAIVNADVSFGTSKELTKLIGRYSPNVFCVPNAADFTLFQKAATEKLERPKELVGVDKKILCYTGNIGSRINYELLRKVAITNTDKLLLMVGPVSNNDHKEFGLDQLPNVLMVGAKDISELPSYLQHSDCLLIPFEYSTLTKSIYPLKINEYLTAGKPVVATAFSEDIQDFSDVAYIAKTEEDFLVKIEQAIQENNPVKVKERIAKAATNTWQARVSLFWDIAESVYDKKNKNLM
jgi:teichuronic acid biosynthesis glycosyltransferase TuaH